MSDKKYKSPLSWYGGKYYMAKDIIDVFPEHKLYVEGFGGAGHVLFKKPTSSMEVYNDLHNGLYLFFKYLRDTDKYQELIKQLQLTPYSREELNASKTWYEETNELERVRKFYVRTMQSVSNNGGWCYSKSNSRRGMCQAVSRWLGNIDENLVDIVERLREVQIENLDIIDLLKKYDKEDTLFYLDPPYIPDTRQQKKSYQHEMTVEQHQALVTTLITLKGKVVLSGYDHDIYAPLLDHGWHKVLLGDFTKYGQCTNTGTLTKGQEFLWCNFGVKIKNT